MSEICRAVSRDRATMLLNRQTFPDYPRDSALYCEISRLTWGSCGLDWKGRRRRRVINSVDAVHPVELYTVMSGRIQNTVTRFELPGEKKVSVDTLLWDWGCLVNKRDIFHGFTWSTWCICHIFAVNTPLHVWCGWYHDHAWPSRKLVQKKRKIWWASVSLFTDAAIVPSARHKLIIIK